MFKKICPSLVTLEQRGTDVALYSVLIYQKYAKNREGRNLTLLNWLFSQMKDVLIFFSLVFIAWTFCSWKAFVQGTYSISPSKLHFPWSNPRRILNLSLKSYGSGLRLCWITESCVCLWGLNMIHYFCLNGMTWHLFSKIVFLSHLSLWTESLVASLCCSGRIWTNFLLISVGDLYSVTVDNSQDYLPSILIFVLLAFNRNCETPCLQGKGESSAEMKLHVTAKFSLTFFLWTRMKLRLTGVKDFGL